MAAKDFLADRIRSQKIITSGNGYPELSIYSRNSLGVDNSGSIDASVLSPATSNVYLFVSGAIGSVQNSTKETVMFGGDVVTKGYTYFENNLTTAGISSSADITTTSSIRITETNQGLYTDNLYKINGDPWDFLTLDNLAPRDLTVNSLSVTNKQITVDNIYSNDDSGLTIHLDNEAESLETNNNAYFRIIGKDQNGVSTSDNPAFIVYENSNFSLGSAISSFPRVWTPNESLLELTSPGNVEIKINRDNSTDGLDESNFFIIKNEVSELFKISETGQITTITGSSLTIDSVVSSITGTVNGINVTEFKQDTEADILSLQQADQTLQSNIDAETIARTTDITSLQNSINDLQADVDQNESDSDAAIAAEAATRLSADQTLQSNIDTEEASRINADLAIHSRIDALQADVDQNEADSDAAESAIIARLNTLEADPTTGSDLSALQADVDQNEADADAAIAAEATARQNDVTNLQNQINNLQADVDQNESDSDAAIAAEAATRLSADQTLQSNIDTLTNTISALQADVDQNEADADTSISQIQNDLATEITNRSNSDNTIFALIQGLQDDVDQNESDGDLDRAAIRNEFAIADSDILGDAGNDYNTLGKLEDKIISLRTDVDQNESDADESISQLQTDLNTEISSRQSADTTLQNNIDTETTARISAVNDLNDLFGNIRQSSGLTSTGLFKSGTDPNVDGYKQSAEDVINFIQPNNVPMTFVQALAQLDQKIKDNLTSIETLDPAGTVVDLTSIKSRLGLDENDDIANTYSSTEFILDVDSHNTAIGKLDAQLSNRINSLSIFNINGIPASNQANDGKILLYNNDGTTETFTYVDPQTGPQGDAGADGRGISSVTENNDGTFTLNFTDNQNPFTTIDLTGPQGPQGEAGPQGQQGEAGPQGLKGDTGDIGPAGPAGDKGDTGDQGPAGAAATITVGNVTTGNSGTNVIITNVGTASAAELDFTIPKGDKGDQGDTGPQGDIGPQGPQGDAGDPGADGADGADAPTITDVSISGTTITTTFSDNTNNQGTFTASIGNLSDVDITTNSPNNGQVLKWDAANSKFVPGNDINGGGDGGGVNLNVTDNTTSVAATATLDVQQLASVTDSGGNEATLVGIIGNAEDNDYTDGLFTDFTSTTTIGTAIDRFNEVLKALAPAPAPDLDQFDVDTANSLLQNIKLSFGTSNDQSVAGTPYASTGNISGFDATDVNEIFSIESANGNYRKGVYTGSTSITGTLNEDVSNDTYTNNVVNYADNSFSDGDQGTLQLWLNGNMIYSLQIETFSNSTCNYNNNTTVTMDDTSLIRVGMQVTGAGIEENTTVSSITNGTTLELSKSSIDGEKTNSTLTFEVIANDYLNAEGSGFINLTAAISGKFSSDTEFPTFKHRQGEWKVDSASQRDGWNYAQVKHVVGANTKETGYAEWINDSNNEAISVANKSLSLNMAGSKYLSGIQYHTSGTATYTADIDNFYKYVYATNNMTFAESPDSIANFDSIAVSSIDTGSGEDHTKQINLSQTSNLFPINNRLLNQSLTTGFSLSHPIKANIATASTNETVTGILLDNVAADSTTTFESFNDENYRQYLTNAYTQANLADATDTYIWDSEQSIIGADSNHNEGLVVYNSRLYSPKSGDLPNNGDFSSLDSSYVNPDYSAIDNSNRYYIRKFKNTSGSTVSEMLLSFNGSNSTITDTDTPTSSQIDIEIKIPSKANFDETNWMSLASAFDLEDYLNDSSVSCGDSEINSNLTINGNLNNLFATFGRDEVLNGEYILARVKAAGNWAGYLDSMTANFTNVLGNVASSPSVKNIDSEQEGVSGKLSFGTTNTIANFFNYTNDINSTFDLSGNKSGIFNNDQNISGFINNLTAANGNSYDQYAFGGDDAELGTLSLNVNGVEKHSIDLSSIPYLSGNQLNENGSGFLNLTVPTPGRDANNRPDYKKLFRTAKFFVDTSDQRLGYNFAKVIHTIGDTSHESNIIEWINDNNTDAPDFTNNGASTYSIDSAQISSTETNSLSGITYYKSVTNVPYEISVKNVYKNIYSSESDAVTVSDVNNNSKIKTVLLTGTNNNQISNNGSHTIVNPTSSSSVSLPEITAAGDESEVLKINSIIEVNYIKSIPDLSSGQPYNNMNDITINARVKHPLTAPNGELTAGVNEVITSEKFLQYNVSTTNQSFIEEDFSNETRRLLSSWANANDNQAAASGSSWDSNVELTDGLMMYDDKLRYPDGDFRDANANIHAPADNPNYTGSTGTKYFYRIFQNNTQNAKTGFSLELQGDGSNLVAPRIEADASTHLSATNIRIAVKIPETGDSQSTGYLNIAKAFETGQYNDGDGSLSGNLSSSITNGQTTTNTITFGQKFLQPNEYFVLRVEANESWTGYLSNITVDWS